MGFSIDLKVGETLSLETGSGRVLLTLLEKSGQRAKIALEAAKDVTWRKGRRDAVSIDTVKKGLTHRR